MTQQADTMIAGNPTGTLLDAPRPDGIAATHAQAPTPGVAPPDLPAGPWGPPTPPHGFAPVPAPMSTPMSVPMTTPMPGPIPAQFPTQGFAPAPGPFPSPVPPPGRSTGKLIAIVAAVGTVGLVAVVLLVGILAAAFSPAPAPAAGPTAPGVSAPAVPSGVPTSDPAATDPTATSPVTGTAADRRATQRAFDAAGVRLDQARTVLDQRLSAAGQKGDMAAFKSASRDFQRELEIYKSAIAGLPMPADQQAVFSGTLMPALDATISDARNMAGAGSVSALKTAARQFDQHWGLVVNTHNQMDRALMNG